MADTAVGMRVWIIALLTLIIQGAFAFLGFLIGLAVVGLYFGYTRAWEVTRVSLPKHVEEDED